MIEGIDERQGGGTVECSTIVQCSRDADRCLVDIGDTEVNLPHDVDAPHNCDDQRRRRRTRTRRRLSSSKWMFQLDGWPSQRDNG
jgi:hypothetical protein